ncbi:hypothetical protein Hanom_Chr09g00778901 [Helianthus anomalus]
MHGNKIQVSTRDHGNTLQSPRVEILVSGAVSHGSTGDTCVITGRPDPLIACNSNGNYYLNRQHYKSRIVGIHRTNRNSNGSGQLYNTGSYNANEPRYNNRNYIGNRQ